MRPRTALRAQVLLAQVRIRLLNVVAVAGAVSALVPLAVRGRPLGARRAVRARSPRVTALPQRRRASPG